MAAYLLVDIDVTDPLLYDEYRAQVPALIAAQGGRYLVRGGAVAVLEGTWQPKRTVVLEFPNMEALRAFWEDPAYQPLRAVRERAAKSNLVAVEGV
ncbi:DUF1330 domain-containing protein [Variovorax dokdonensis]|uniref:DUF1330 domain-containing protein n=1 Tax=Variovorax dokdonensis TaxID=344883 RepID=A0ABT7NFF5_9BURK|nr:DUF1330 domain-containing protein [Variovorax dokdonensis]MDM0046565.1 DUF1330 domain-containing protein [Variovorax dokdonensis]